MKNIIRKYRSLPIQVKASLWFLICSFLQKGVSVITTPIFTRLLTTTEFGQYNVFNSWLRIISIFVSLNLSHDVFGQGLVKYSDNRNVFSSSLQGLSTFLVIVWTGIYLLFRNFWNNLFGLSTVQMMAMLLMIWTSAVFGFWASEQRVEYKYKMLVFITVIISIAKPAVGVFFVLNSSDKVTARILGIALVELIVFLGMFVAQMARGKCFYNGHFWKYAIAYNSPLILHYLSQTVLISADRIMIERMVGSSEAGIYSLAYAISQVMNFFNTALLQTLTPWIYEKIKQKKISEISSKAYLALICIAAANLLLIVLAPEAVAIFAPVEYREAIWIIPPIAMSVYFMFCYDMFAKFAFYYEKTSWVMFGSIIGAVLNLVLNYLFIDIFGYQAAGYTTLVCYLVYAIGHYLFMNKVCDEYCDGVRPYEHKKILGITLLFLIAGFVLLMTYHYILLRYGIIVIAGVFALVKRKRIIEII